MRGGPLLVFLAFLDRLVSLWLGRLVVGMLFVNWIVDASILRQVFTMDLSRCGDARMLCLGVVTLVFVVFVECL